MNVFSSPAFDDHEQVVFFHDAEAGLRAIVAIHDVTLGPAVGGCRMWPYASEQDALIDVLRLARGMTYKAAMAEVPFGGGKAVVIGDPKKDKSERLFRAFGRAIDGLAGRYYTAEDVGTGPMDMDWVGEETPYVLGRERGGSGDPSPITAHGVWLGIKTAVRHRLGRTDLAGVHIAVQGLGHVGYNLARFLHQDGARLTVADLDPARAARAARELGARVVPCEQIVDVPADVFAPCALGAVINDATLPRLACAIVAGAANNQLLEARHGDALHARGILYAPDYVINAGGIINIALELESGGYRAERALERAGRIATTLEEIFQRAAREGVPTYVVADRIAEERLHRARKSQAWPVRRPSVSEPERQRAAS